MDGVSLLWREAEGQALAEALEGLTGPQEVLVELAAPLQYPRQLLQLGLHVTAVVLVDRVHVLLHLLAELRHLRGH